MKAHTIKSTDGQVLAVVKRIRSTSARELQFPDGTTVLFSYATPVALYVETGGLEFGSGYYRTTHTYSRTTSKHVSQWQRFRKTWEGYCDTIEPEELRRIVFQRLGFHWGA